MLMNFRPSNFFKEDFDKMQLATNRKKFNLNKSEFVESEKDRPHVGIEKEKPRHQNC